MNSGLEEEGEGEGEGSGASAFSNARRRSPFETPTVLNVDPGRSSILLPFQTKKKPSVGTSIFVQSVRRRKKKGKRRRDGQRAIFECAAGGVLCRKGH